MARASTLRQTPCLQPLLLPRCDYASAHRDWPKVAVNRGYVLDAVTKTAGAARWAFLRLEPLSELELAAKAKVGCDVWWSQMCASDCGLKQSHLASHGLFQFHG
jgi:hypothetical protein